MIQTLALKSGEYRAPCCSPGLAIIAGPKIIANLRMFSELGRFDRHNLQGKLQHHMDSA